MPTDVIMPQMGESIFEGTITKWLKKAGDTVQKDEPLFEISTDKVDAEIPSPVTGVLSEIKFPEGSTVQVNTIVAVVADSGSPAVAAQPAPRPAKQAEKPSATPTSAPSKPTPPPIPAPGSVSGGTQVVMPQMGESIFEGTITKWLKKVGDTVQKDEPLFEISTDKVDAEIPSPITGVLTEIKAAEGTTVEVNAVVAIIGGSASESSPAPVALSAAPIPQAKPAAATLPPQQAILTAPQAGRRLRSSPLVRRIAKENNIDLAQVPGSGSDGRITKDDILRYLAQPASKAPVPAAPALKGEVVPLTRMRAIIAQRMVESKRISPHVHSVYRVDMTRIVRLREREKSGFEQRTGVKLTYMPFIATAAIEALRRYPIVNASLIDNSIHYHANINLGIAVALEWGLIVPTVREAEQRSFSDLARTINDLASRARSKKLSPDEVGGSTFTLTNSGIFGDEFGTPIINQPESAILAIGALRKEPVVLTDAEGNDTIAIRSMQHFCLGFDHRLIDGADGGKFMSEFKKTLETWNREIS
jgi:pyruvate dehydrogenase E2 component (dihydrolipoamide acetyltransferase)